jgi:hypothetical protein
VRNAGNKSLGIEGSGVRNAGNKSLGIEGSGIRSVPAITRFTARPMARHR